MSNISIGAIVAFKDEDDIIEVGCVETIYTASGAALIEWYADDDKKWFHAYVLNHEINVLENNSVSMKGFII